MNQNDIIQNDLIGAEEMQIDSRESEKESEGSDGVEVSSCLSDRSMGSIMNLYNSEDEENIFAYSINNDNTADQGELLN